MKPEHILALASIKGEPGEAVPYPMVAAWQRMRGWVDMQHLPYLHRYIKDFKDPVVSFLPMNELFIVTVVQGPMAF